MPTTFHRGVRELIHHQAIHIGPISKVPHEPSSPAIDLRGSVNPAIAHHMPMGPELTAPEGMEDGTATLEASSDGHLIGDLPSTFHRKAPSRTRRGHNEMYGGPVRSELL
jgi:hypothetical protein